MIDKIIQLSKSSNMGTQMLKYCSVFILFAITATNANLNNILSDEVVEKCATYGDNSHGIHRCLKNEIKNFCDEDSNLNINGTRHLDEVGQVFCDLMGNGKRHKHRSYFKKHKKHQRRHNKLIPLSVRDNCLDIDGSGDDDSNDDDCIQKELEAYCGALELNSTDSNEDMPFDMPICSCYNQQGRRNMKQCIKDQKKKFCEEQDNKDTFECKRMKECGSFGGRQFRACAEKLCFNSEISDNFGCQKLKCKDSNNRRQKRKCLQNLCQKVNYAEEFLCIKLKDKTTRKTNRKMLRKIGRSGRPWKRSKNPIPKVVKKMCRDEEAEDKDDCILGKLEDTCKMINETFGSGDNEACKCIGNADYPETIDGLRLCVKSHMLKYCQDENDDIEKTFECRKMEECEGRGDGRNKFRKRQCIKKLCKERLFVDTCHCKKGRRERKKCFRYFERDDLEM